MKRAILVFTMGLALGVGARAQALGSLAEIAIIDRDTGVTLTPYYYHGEYWVAGRPGARYAIEIHNRAGERLLAVTSVDGINVLSGETAAWDQGGYVFEPGELYQITGWRKSDAEVAAFTFTESPGSYAERTGRPANVGVIGVALFRERRPQALRPPAERMPGAVAAPLAGMDSRAERAPKLGTGHGERESSYVDHTEFARLQLRPNEVVRIRYDSLENLLAMGVIRRGPAPPPLPNPFPAAPSPGYVPDPPG